jgi:Arc/MetJ family transcription regulator
MRTTLDIPDELLDEARRVSHSRTKREAVLAGLEELIRTARLEELRQLRGKVDLYVDFKKSRKKR